MNKKSDIIETVDKIKSHLSSFISDGSQTSILDDTKEKYVNLFFLVV